jgi:hypothetical protein
MPWARAALVLCVVVAACRFSVRGIDVDGGSNTDMKLPPGDAGGGDAAGCSLGCPNGCVETPTPHCLSLQPSGPASASDYNQPGLANITVNNNVTIDTDTGAISGGITRSGMPGVIGGIGYRGAAQSGGPGVGVFSVAGLTVGPNAKLTVKGSNAFVLVASGDVVLEGQIFAACNGNVAGPGGSAGGSNGDGLGPGGGKAGSASGGGSGGASGGGGAGYGDSGGHGGLIATQTTSNEGVIWGDITSPTFTLAGGSGGGRGGSSGGVGGAGGGAVQIASNGNVRIDGIINVGGCGGKHGAKNQGGGGAGSGGAIVIEAAHIALTATAVLAANGGSGAAGDDMSQNGNDANANVIPAIGGMSTSPNGGAGGNGGASNGTPGQHFTNGRVGTIPSASSGFGGGGGGGCGRIGLRALPSGISDNSSSVTPDGSDTNTAGAKLTFYGLANFQ